VTLSNTKRWLDDVLNVLKEGEPRPLVFLLGAKKDLLDSHETRRSERDAMEFASQINAEYWSVSSFTGKLC